MKPLLPGSWVGVLGAGQLGRLVAVALARMGMRSFVWGSRADDPALALAARAMVAPWEDAEAQAAFAEASEAAVYEFENVPVALVEALAAAGVATRPGAASLRATSDRVREKTLFASLGMEVAPWAPIASHADLAEALRHVGLPAIAKTRSGGYDGHGQRAVASLEDAQAALDDFAVPMIIERRVAFACEAAQVGARGADGACAFYDLTRTTHEGGILRKAEVPSRLPARLEAQARDWAQRLMDDLDHVGVLALETFVVGEGSQARLLANEAAPRVHNAAHWTLQACPVDQFALAARAACGWPLGNTAGNTAARVADATMVNLLGEEAHAWLDWERRGFVVDLYGKHEARAGRKMGHATRLYPLEHPSTTR